MIPVEAVEAAASIPGVAILAAEAAVFDAMIEHGPNRHTDGHDKIARAALEAAAPHMLAAAWDEALKRAAEVAWEHDASASSGVSQIPNPYVPAQEATHGDD